MAAEEMKSRGIQSIETGVQILKIIAEADKPLSISEIAKMLQTSKSKLHRYLVSFTKTGILDKSPDAKYTLGTELIRLGLKASQKLRITEIAAPHLIELKEKLNETAALAIWGENGPFFASWEQSNYPVNIGIKVATEIRITTSATGLIFAAYLPAEVTKKLIEQELTKNPSAEENFLQGVEFVKKHQYAFVQGTLLPGINGISAPVFDMNNQLAAALTLVGLETTLDVRESSEEVRLLKEKARLISESLGWQGRF